MKRIVFYILIALVFVSWGCRGTSKQIIPEGTQDHEHFHTNTKAIGDYHAQLVVNHRSGKISLLIYDIHEKPKGIAAQSIDALMTLPDGIEKSLSFIPDRVMYTRKPWKNKPIKKIYIVQGEWLKSVHKFDIKFNIPISGNIYEVGFSYETSEEEDTHHEHE